MYVGFEILTGVAIENSIFWYIRQRIVPLSTIHRRVFLLLYPVGSLSLSESQCEMTGWLAIFLPVRVRLPASLWCVAWLILRPWSWRRHSIDFHQTTRRYIPEDRTLHPKPAVFLKRDGQIFTPTKNNSLICGFIYFIYPWVFRSGLKRKNMLKSGIVTSISGT
jgi:hypothetical protein